MKYKVTVLLLFLGHILGFSQKISQYSECYLGQVVKIQTCRDLYTNYDRNRKRLIGPLEKLKQSSVYINQEYTIKEIISDIPNQNDDFFFCAEDACIVVLEPKQGNQLLYYYSICGNFPNGITSANVQCTFHKLENFECTQFEEDYKNLQRSKIRYKEDIFTGLKSYDTNILFLGIQKSDMIFALKVNTDSIPRYAVTISLQSDNLRKNTQGCYVVFDDSSRFMRPSAEISFDYNENFTYKPYTHKTIIYLTESEFHEFCNKGISAIRVGGVDITDISEETQKKIKSRFQALVEASFN